MLMELLVLNKLNNTYIHTHGYNGEVLLGPLVITMSLILVSGRSTRPHWKKNFFA